MLIDFLKTSRSKEELAIALATLRDFKRCESAEEYLAIDFVAWVKLEQFQEFLLHLVEGAPLADDTLIYIKEMESR